MAHQPAYRIKTPRLLIRCWEPQDAPRLKKAVDENRDYLRPWLPWAQKKRESLQEFVERLREFRAKFDLDNDYIFGILDPEDRQVLGGCGLHLRVGEGAREIGYWIHQDFRGRGLATEAVGALVKVAFELEGLKRVEIRCDPANVASAAIPARLGFRHEATLQKRKKFSGKWIDLMVWSLFREDYPRSPASRQKIQAFDVLGRELRWGTPRPGV